MIGLGTIVNVTAVLVGSLIGLIIKGGLKQRFQDIILQSVGLATIFIGAAGTIQCMFLITETGIKVSGTIMMPLSLVIGAIIGEAIDIEKRMDQFGSWLKRNVKSNQDSKFIEGFVTASLVVCIGAMAVVGSIQDGINADPSILYAKSILDFVIVIIFSSTFGKGVMFSAIPLGIYQGTLTLLARFIAPVLNDYIVNNLSFVGSILIFTIGINLTFGKRIKVGNMLPSLLVVILFSLIVSSI
ncbi:MAG TPA: DUF554 domain-containing protein [Ruminococcaceae bacterium]|nr:DUF554 domain-containing protein [Oscillospiraceae bacterium]HCA30134.1 DUF554 domain-containing protein [Oscillospiraceae bacterium]